MQPLTKSSGHVKAMLYGIMLAYGNLTADGFE